jgi:hypothetical protein
MSDVSDGEIEDLQHGVIGGEVPSGLGDLAQLVVDRFDGIGIRYETVDAAVVAWVPVLRCEGRDRGVKEEAS